MIIEKDITLTSMGDPMGKDRHYFVKWDGNYDIVGTDSKLIDEEVVMTLDSALYNVKEIIDLDGNRSLLTRK